jgi:hypothetical protein
LWAERIDGALDDIFSLQDRITTNVVGAILPMLEQAEIKRAQRKATGSLDAYDFYLRGMASVHDWTREGVSQALGLFYEAIKADANSDITTAPEQERREAFPAGE